MIVFFSFVPIDFNGGAEKWMMQTASKLSKQEKTMLVYLSPSLTNWYGRLVLKRSFENRLKNTSIFVNLEKIIISAQHVIPFSQSYYKIQKQLHNARVIYANFQVMEVFLLMYFGGKTVLQKTVFGLHSPFHYRSPQSFFDHLHNVVYGSSFMLSLLKKVKAIHVLNNADFLFFKSHHFTNVVHVPNTISYHQNNPKPIQADSDSLEILFVGELTKRKGIDILIEVIKQSPQTLQFHIAGDGPYAESIAKLAKSHSNCFYHSYADQKKLQQLYSFCKVLILPSFAESMSLAVLEALSHGLSIVSSPYITMQLPSYIQYSPMAHSPEEYSKLLSRLLHLKQHTGLPRQEIIDYFQSHFSEEVIFPRLEKYVFNL